MGGLGRKGDENAFWFEGWNVNGCSDLWKTLLDLDGFWAGLVLFDRMFFLDKYVCKNPVYCKKIL